MINGEDGDGMSIRTKFSYRGRSFDFKAES